MSIPSSRSASVTAESAIMRRVSARDVKTMLGDGQELALIDVREELNFLARPPAARALRAAEPARAEVRAPGAAALDAHRAVRRGRWTCEARGGNPCALRLRRSLDSRRRPCGLGGGRVRAVLRRQRSQQGLWRVRRASDGTPSIAAEELDVLMTARPRHGGARQPAVRRIFAHLDPGRRQRAGRRTRLRVHDLAPSPATPWWSIAPGARAASSARSR